MSWLYRTQPTPKRIPSIKPTYHDGNIKTTRREKYPILFEIMKRLLSNTEIKLHDCVDN